MTRAEEYHALLQELEETPAALNSTVARAKARRRRKKLREYVGAPLISLSAACVAFVLLVNFSTPFAMACAKVPFFRELAEAVSFHPSLYAAVENEWVQPIGQTDTDNGYTMTVEYLIVDRKQLNVFYTLEGGEEVDPEDSYLIDPVFMDGQGEDLTATTISGSSQADGELYYATADFLTEDTMPGQIRMECELRLHWDESESKRWSKPVANFTFELSFDPQFTVQPEVVELNNWLELDGQQIMLKNVEIYPTHMRVNLEDHPDNTAWLRDLELYVENEKGARFDGVKNGISSTGSPDSPFTRSFRLETSFFADSERLTLCITEAKWLEKDRQWTWVDVSNGETGWLPDGVTLEQYSRTGDETQVKFRVCVGEGAPLHNPFYRWREPGQEEQYIGRHSTSTAWDDENGASIEGYCDVRMSFAGLAGDRLELMLDYSMVEQYTKPVEIPIQ